ncbi:MAG: Uma2 family endonuclease [Candidatus Poribacteria bacterium]|nr:Uma2 family endonuclease [Candidatus Poribacteria bacterium]
MKPLNDFAEKQRKYMPTVPKPTGKPTVYIPGYPYEDEEPMPATGFHGEQINILYEQLSSYFATQPDIYIGVDNFIYYREGDTTKNVAPDIYVVLSAAKFPLRRSFYTWTEGAVPTVLFEFLSDSTADEDREAKVGVYLRDIGAQEYFIHQPEMEKPAEFRGWRREVSGDIVEMLPDADGGLFSESLNLSFRWTDQQHSHVRLLRPYLPDGTPITTATEERSLHAAAKKRVETAEFRAEAAEVRAETAELRVDTERDLRAEAEARAAAETHRREALERELEQLRRQLTDR